MITWVDTFSEYRAVVAIRTQLPIIRPQNSFKEAHWRQVLSKMYAEKYRMSRDRDVMIISVGENTWLMAALYAGVMDYPLMQVSDTSSVIKDIREAPARSIMIIIMAHELKVGFVASILEAAALAEKTVGFLCGRDESALSYTVAKAVLEPSLTDNNGLVVDAPHHIYAEDEHDAEQLTLLLTRPTMMKTIRSHGEGSHAKLPSLTVCGLLEESEFPQAPGCGCSRKQNRCKRIHGKTKLVYGLDICAYVVNYVCCNGFNVAGELYRSPVSMALALTEGWPAALLAPIRPLIAPDYLLVLLREMAENGVPLGQIAAAINDACAALGQPFTFALLGDPALRLNLNAIHQDSGELVLRAATDNREELPVSQATAEPIRWINALLEQSLRGHRLLRSIDAWLGNAAGAQLTSLGEKLADIERLALFAIKQYEIDFSLSRYRGACRTTALIRMLIGQWEKMLASLLHGARENFDVFDLIHYDKLQDEINTAAPCKRCGTPTEITLFGKSGTITGSIETHMCRVCGPLSAYRCGGIRLEILTEPLVAQQGESVTMKIRLHASSELYPVSQRVRIELRGYDKSNGQCFISSSQTLATVNSCDIPFNIQLDNNQGCDLHSIRIIAIMGFDIAFCRVRLACFPK